MTLRTLAALGDSQSDLINSNAVDAFRTWVPVTARLLNSRARASIVRGRAFGAAAETTTQMLARVQDLLLYDTPLLAVIFGGINDSGASITTATTTQNIQAMVLAVRHAAVGDGLSGGATVAGQASLPATGELGQRYVVLNDTSTTGGAAAKDTSQTATITGSVAADVNGNKQAVWEFRYPLAGEAGWGRVAVASTAVTLGAAYVAVIGQGYRNYPTGGDTTGGTSTNANLIAAQSAAATATGATFIDLYAYQRARILAGTDADLSAGFVAASAWNVADGNIHHNAYGHAIVAEALLQGLPGACITALTT